MNNNFNVGLYIRLSRDDGNVESNSIISQRKLLNQYINENNYHKMAEYVDDGYTGTNFERPAFQKMLQDIKSGKINMIITKDMSRLGRDYIGTGELIEKYFPNNNVRYIAINDGIDTFLDSTNNDIAPFKAIMNDMYAKDISKKVKTSLYSRMKDGLYVSGRCPFGYMKDINNKNHLVKNEGQAQVVELIFHLALEGKTYHSIAKELTKRKIKTPSSYYNYVWNSKCLSQHNGIWVPTTVKSILTNQIYAGDMVQSKTKKINYKLKKTIKNNPQDYIVVENTHDAIINRETFNYVQTLLTKNVKRPEKKNNYLLDGLLYCGDCQHRISIRYQKKYQKSYTTCNYYRTYSKYHLCTSHTNNYETIEKIVINNVLEILKKHLDMNQIQNELNQMNIENNTSNITKRVLDLELKNNKLVSSLDKTYIDLLNGLIDENQYARVNKILKDELENNEKIIVKLKRTLDSNKDNNQMIINRMLNQPSRELIINIVDKIYIYQDKRIDIIFNFNNPCYNTNRDVYENNRI